MGVGQLQSKTEMEQGLKIEKGQVRKAYVPLNLNSGNGSNIISTALLKILEGVVDQQIYGFNRSNNILSNFKLC